MSRNRARKEKHEHEHESGYFEENMVHDDKRNRRGHQTSDYNRMMFNDLISTSPGKEQSKSRSSSSSTSNSSSGSDSSDGAAELSSKMRKAAIHSKETINHGRQDREKKSNKKLIKNDKNYSNGPAKYSASTKTDRISVSDSDQSNDSVKDNQKTDIICVDDSDDDVRIVHGENSRSNSVHAHSSDSDDGDGDRVSTDSDKPTETNEMQTTGASSQNDSELEEISRIHSRSKLYLFSKFFFFELTT